MCLIPIFVFYVGPLPAKLLLCLPIALSQGSPFCDWGPRKTILYGLALDDFGPLLWRQICNTGRLTTQGRERRDMWCRRVVIERARIQQLIWGNERDTLRIRTLRPQGFDIVVGSDVAYVEEAIPALLHAVSSQLSHEPQVKPHLPRPEGHAVTIVIWYHPDHILLFRRSTSCRIVMMQGQ